MMKFKIPPKSETLFEDIENARLVSNFFYGQVMTDQLLGYPKLIVNYKFGYPHEALVLDDSEKVVDGFIGAICDEYPYNNKKFIEYLV